MRSFRVTDVWGSVREGWQITHHAEQLRRDGTLMLGDESLEQAVFVLAVTPPVP
jgi:hypothetical protein